MNEQPNRVLVAGRVYRNGAPLPVWGPELKSYTDSSRSPGPYQWLPAGALFRVTDMIAMTVHPVAEIEVLEGPATDNRLYLFASSGVSCHEADTAPPPVPFKRGRTYRCVRPIQFWAVDRLASRGPWRGSDTDLAAGSEIRVRVLTTEQGVDVVEIDVLKGDTSTVCDGLECNTDDYRTYAAHAADCEPLALLADDLPAGAYRCLRDVTVVSRDFDKVNSEVAVRMLSVGTEIRVALQVYFGANNPLPFRHFTDDGSKPKEDAPVLGDYIALEELDAGCELIREAD